jgi:hypothetical protein
MNMDPSSESRTRPSLRRSSLDQQSQQDSDYTYTYLDTPARTTCMDVQVHNTAASTASNARFSSTASSVRWSKAIRTVMMHQEHSNALDRDDAGATKTKGSTAKNTDPLGDCLTEMLNRHPQFTTRQRNGKDDSETNGDVDSLQTTLTLTYPLLSRHNARVARHYLGALGTGTEIKRVSAQMTNFLFQARPSGQSSLGFSLAVVLVLLLAIVSASHVFILYAAQAAVLIGTHFLFLLFDWEDLRQHCPDTVWKLLDTIAEYWQWFDAHVLLGRRFVGREWNKNDFEWNDPFQAKSCMQSDSTTLWELPPPSVKQGRRLCLSTDYMARPEWSRDTVGHVVAVDFCYVMLREDHLRKQAIKAKSASSTSSSGGFLLHDNDGEEIALTPVKKKRPRSYSTSALRGMDGTDLRITLRNDTTSSVVNVMPSMNSDRRRYSNNNSNHMDNSIHSSQGGEAYEMEVGGDERVDDSTNFGEEESESGHAMPGSNNNDQDEDAAHFHPDRFPCDRSIASDASEVAADLPWIDVGAKIGIRLLNSAHVQRAMTSSETTDRIFNMSKEMESKFKQSKDRGRYESGDATSNAGGAGAGGNHPRAMFSRDGHRDAEARSEAGLSKPVHSMWTSPSAAAPSRSHSRSSSLSDHEYASLVNGLLPPAPVTLPTIITKSQSPPPPSNRSLLPPRSPRNSLTPPFTRRNSSELSASRALDTDADVDTDTDIVSPIDPNDGLLDVPKINRNGVQANDGMSLLSYEIKGGAVELSLNATKAQAQANTSRMDSRVPLLSTQPGAGPEKGKADYYKRAPLLPGVKVAVPLFPLQPGKHMKKVSNSNSHFQMATVASSKRIYVGSDESLAAAEQRASNCLSVTVKLDKSFLRNGEFAEMTFRVMDEWSNRYMPKHSKVPVGASVATTYGICILVGWRVEDDSHVMRSLWQRRGPGSAHAYLNRDAIHGTVEAAVGFRVQTKFGWGDVLAYVDGGRTFESGRFFVAIKEEGRFNGNVIEQNRKDVLSCHGAQFIPVIEHVREAANYQIQVDNYNAALREHRLDMRETEPDSKFWEAWSACLEIMWTSFLKAVDEDKDFDDGVNEFMSSIITFLDRLDSPSTGDDESDAGQGMLHHCVSNDFEVECIADKESIADAPKAEDGQEPGFWFMNDILGGLFGSNERNEKVSPEDESVGSRGREESSSDDHNTSFYDKTFAILRTLMKTVSIARASSTDYPHFTLALAIAYDGLLFVRTIFRVQQKNVSEQSLEVWKRALEEISSTFGPIKERLEKIGLGIAQRMEKQGRRAKIRVLKFVDTILGDERLLLAMEQGEWDQCALRLESAIIHARILDEKGLEQYRKIAKFGFDHLQMAMSTNGSAAARNNEKLAFLAHAVQWIASPRRSLLKLISGNDVLELLERILVRVFYNEELASRMLTIHASNFHSLRHLRLLKDFSVAGRIWMPLLDAADEEFSWVASRMPDNTKEFMCPLSSLFSLCVAQFHKIYGGDLSKDWLDFLLEEDAVRIIHDIDMKLILALESFSRDVKEMFVVLPYYPRYVVVRGIPKLLCSLLCTHICCQ